MPLFHILQEHVTVRNEVIGVFVPVRFVQVVVGNGSVGFLTKAALLFVHFGEESSRWEEGLEGGELRVELLRVELMWRVELLRIELLLRVEVLLRVELLRIELTLRRNVRRLTGWKGISLRRRTTRKGRRTGRRHWMRLTLMIFTQ